jgi:hypothetical protein
MIGMGLIAMATALVRVEPMTSNNAVFLFQNPSPPKGRLAIWGMDVGRAK